VRFRQSDTLNRLAAILQLSIFASLSAFTAEFDITAGLGSSQPNQFDNETKIIQTHLNFSTVGSVHQHSFPEDDISVLHFKGISMTMALSRLLLMVQYLIVLAYALYRRPGPISIRSFFTTSTALITHIVSLLFSAALFFAAFGVVRNNPSTQDNIAKIVLWYTALTVELLAHFVPPLFHLSGHVQYPPASLYSRASILFLVVLGQELDKLTGTFRLIVGPVGFGVTSTFMLISTGIILVGQFYFFLGTPPLKTKTSRGLAWFFGQFIYTMALIILLSCEKRCIYAPNPGSLLLNQQPLTNWYFLYGSL